MLDISLLAKRLPTRCFCAEVSQKLADFPYLCRPKSVFADSFTEG